MGVRNFWRGVREKGGSDEPPNPPWLRACVTVSTRVVKVVSHIRSVSSLVHSCGQFLCRDTGRKTPWNFPNLNNIHSRDDVDVVMQLSQGRTH